ncbi:MAG: membrane protein insertase YidC [Clostridia bacterium]|nr:membrane protein insertase YidC [Clostridia bacterium]
MKRNTKLTKKLLTRVVMGLLLLAMLSGVLTSCRARGGSTITTVTKGYVIGSNMLTEANGLTAAQLDKLADEIVASKNAATIRTQLVAALRGYDMSLSDFDDAKVESGELAARPEDAPAMALNILQKNGIETSPYKNTAGDPVMTAADVETLVKVFQTNVDVDAKLGLIDQLLHWIGLGFEWLINVPGFGSFILGTVYFAIALELVMIPLAVNQQKNSRKQAMLRPREMAIRNRYKGRNDQATQQKVTREIQDLYTKEGYSPMSGCLPLLITLPFLMFLYYIVIDPMTYIIGAPAGLSSAFLTFADAPVAAGGLGLSLGSSRGTIEVLSLIRENGISIDGFADFAFFANGGECLAALDGMVDRIPDFNLFGLNLGLTPEIFNFSSLERGLLQLMPVLTFLVYWGSGKITRKFSFQPMQGDAAKDPAQGCSNGMMNIMMPAMSAWFTFMVPAAVGLYWLFKSILSTIKTIIVAKVMPLPTFTEEDYKAAERELMGKDKNKPVKRDPDAPRNPNVRSLHHIDDEDYESPAEREARLAARKRDYVEEDDAPKATTADNAYSEGVTLKEDDRPARKDKNNKNKKDSDD